MAAGFSILIPRRRWLYWGLAVSLAAHVLVFVSYVSLRERVREVVHRITFEPTPPPSLFVKAPTAATKTLEFRKVPLPRGWLTQKRTGAVRTNAPEIKELAALRTDALLAQLQLTEVVPPSLGAGSRIGPGREVTPMEAAEASVAFRFPEPSLGVVAIRGIREVRNQVDMRLDMLGVENLDTGQYTAMVIQDPADRTKIKGFIHLAQAYTKISYGDVNERQDIELVNLNYLVRALQEYTGIRADYRGSVPLDDPDLQQIPWLLLPSGIDDLKKVALTDPEIENLGRYIVGGGFVLGRMGGGSASKSAVQRTTGIFDILRQALKTQRLNEGAHWRFVVLEPDHPIYHALFDFDSSVHENQMDLHSAGNPLTKDMGLVVGDRLAVFLYSSREITSKEGGILGGQSTHLTQGDATRSLQFSVNTVVFALTQEGSVTQQLMSGVR